VTAAMALGSSEIRTAGIWRINAITALASSTRMGFGQPRSKARNRIAPVLGVYYKRL